MLTRTQRERLNQACDTTYRAYAALHVASEQSVGRKTLLEYVNDTLTKNHLNRFPIETQNSIYDCPCRIKIDKTAAGTITVNIAKTDGGPFELPTKGLRTCNAEEKLALLASVTLTLDSVNIKNKEVRGFCVETDDSLGKPVKLGGAGKLMLYPEHIQTLFDINQHLKAGSAKDSEKISSMLVALATGSGKTFVQALWMVVLSMANINGIFALPDKLVNQFIDDVRKFLPDTMGNLLQVLRKDRNRNNAETIKTIEAMNASRAQKSAIVVAAFEALLDKQFEALMRKDGDDVLLSFDEQHLVVQREAWRLKLESLAQRHVSMFLTATPNEATYELCGKKPVAFMSNKAKGAAGHGEFPSMTFMRAQTLSDLIDELKLPLTSSDKMSLAMVNSVLPERSSAVNTLFRWMQGGNRGEFWQKPDERLMQQPWERQRRWCAQIPTAAKMLIIGDDPNEVINFWNFLEDTDRLGDFRAKDENNEYVRVHNNDDLPPIEPPPVFEMRNIINRAGIFEFFMCDKVIDQVAADAARVRKRNIDEDRDKTRTIYRVSFKNQVDRNIFSGIVNYILSDITGYSVIELDVMRKQDLDALFNQIDPLIKKFVADKGFELNPYFYKKLCYVEGENEKGIDEEGARLVASMCVKMLRKYTQEGYQAWSLDTKKEFIDNWTLNNHARDTVCLDNDFITDFDSYLKNHRVIFLLDGMETADVPMEPRPFAGFDVELQPIRDPNTGQLSPAASERELTTYELFHPTLKQYIYKPRYVEGMTEVMADNVFKLFGGVYFSPKKMEGFSDLNLSVVIFLVSKRSNKLKHPAANIQVVGRLRGKNPTVTPQYFCAHDDFKFPFDLTLLRESDDYYPQFFRAVKKHMKESVRFIGEEIASKINTYLYSAADQYGNVNYDAYSDEVRLIILRAFREIYNSTNHNMPLAKKYLQQALQVTLEKLDEKIKTLREPTLNMSVFAKVAGTLLNVRSVINYNWNTGARFKAFSKKVNELRAASKGRPVTPELLYGEIIQRVNYQQLQEKSKTFAEFLVLFKERSLDIEFEYKRHLSKSLSPENIAKFNEDILKRFLPLIVKYINPDKQKTCLREAAEFKDWYSVFIISSKLFEDFEHANAPDAEMTRSQIAMAIFRKVPKLRHYFDEKTDAYDFDSTEQKMKKISEETQVKIEEGLTTDLADFLSLNEFSNRGVIERGFLYHIRPLLIPDDYAALVDLFENRKHAEAFAQYIIQVGKNKDARVDLQDVESQLGLLREYFSDQPRIASIISVPERARRLVVKFDHISEKIVSAMRDNATETFGDEFYNQAATIVRDETREEIRSLFKDSLMQCLAMMFRGGPRDGFHERLLATIAGYDKWDELSIKFSYDQRIKGLIKGQVDVENLAEVKEIAIDVFRAIDPTLTAEELNSHYIDLTAVARDAAERISQMVSKITSAENSGQAEKTAQMAAYLKGRFLIECEPLLIPVHYAVLTRLFEQPGNVEKFLGVINSEIIQLLQKFIQSDQFVRAIKPLFFKEDHERVLAALRNDASALAIATVLFNASGAESREPDRLLVTALRSAGLGGIDSLRGHAERVKAELELETAAITESVNKDPQACLDIDRFSQLIAGHLLPKEQANLNEFCNTQLMPILLKNFTKDAQQEIKNALQNYNGWPVIIMKFANHPALTELRALDEQRDADKERNKASDEARKAEIFAQISVGMVSETGRANKFVAQTRDFKATVESAAKSIQANFENLSSTKNLVSNLGATITGAFTGLFSANKTMKSGVGANLLANYLRNEFLKDIEPLFIEEDLVAFQTIFGNTDCCAAFSAFIVENELKQPGYVQKNDLIVLLKQFFSTYADGKYGSFVSKITPIDSRIEMTVNGLSATAELYKKDIDRSSSDPNYRMKYFTSNPIDDPQLTQALKPAVRNRINKLGKTELSRILAAFFQPEYQDNILRDCALFDNWPEFLFKNQKRLADLNDADLAPKIILELTRQIPGLKELRTDQLIAIDDSRRLLESGMEEITEQAKNKLAEPKDVLRKLVDTFKDEPGVAKLVSADVVLSSAREQLTLIGDAITSEMNADFSNPNDYRVLKGNPQQFHEIADTLNADNKEQMVRLARNEMIPIFLSCVVPSMHQAIIAASNQYQHWPSLLSRYKTELQALSDEGDINKTTMLVFKILSHLPGMANTLDMKRHAHDLASSRDYLQKSFSNLEVAGEPFNKQSIERFMVYIFKTLKFAWRDLMSQADWDEFANKLHLPGNGRRLAEAIIVAVTDANKRNRSFSLKELIETINLTFDLKIVDIKTAADQINGISDILVNLIKQQNRAITAADKSKLIAPRIISALNIDAFRTTMLHTLGHFFARGRKEEEVKAYIACYMEVFNKNKGKVTYELPAIRDYMAFTDIIYNVFKLADAGNIEAIYKNYIEDDIVRFMDAAVDQKPIAVEELKFYQLWRILMEIHKDELRCIQFYNRYNQSKADAQPLLVLNPPPDISDTLFSSANRLDPGQTFADMQIFDLNALKTSMTLNKEVSGAQKVKICKGLSVARFHILEPMYHVLRAADVSVPARPTPEQGVLAFMSYQAKSLASEILRATPMLPNDVYFCEYEDVIAPLELAITSNRQTSKLAEWWQHESQQAGVGVGSRLIKDISHFVTICNLESNESIRPGYKAVSDYLRARGVSDKNDLFVRYKRVLYTQMIYNSAQIMPEYYKMLIEFAADYLIQLANPISGIQPDRLENCKFDSDTLTMMKSVLLNQSLAPEIKLARLQYHAQDYFSGTSHNILRWSMQMMSSSKRELDKKIAEFCGILGDDDLTILPSERAKSMLIKSISPEDPLAEASDDLASTWEVVEESGFEEWVKPKLRSAETRKYVVEQSKSLLEQVAAKVLIELALNALNEFKSTQASASSSNAVNSSAYDACVSCLTDSRIHESVKLAILYAILSHPDNRVLSEAILQQFPRLNSKLGIPFTATEAAAILKSRLLSPNVTGQQVEMFNKSINVLKTGFNDPKVLAVEIGNLAMIFDSNYAELVESIGALKPEALVGLANQGIEQQMRTVALSQSSTTNGAGTLFKSPSVEAIVIALNDEGEAMTPLLKLMIVYAVLTSTAYEALSAAIVKEFPEFNEKPLSPSVVAGILRSKMTENMTPEKIALFDKNMIALRSALKQVDTLYRTITKIIAVLQPVNPPPGAQPLDSKGKGKAAKTT